MAPSSPSSVVHERARLLPGKRRDLHRPPARDAAQGVALVRRTGGQNERDWQARRDASQRREQLKRFLVAPMHIVDGQYQWRVRRLRPADRDEGVRHAALARVRVQPAPRLIAHEPQKRAQRLRVRLRPQLRASGSVLQPSLDLDGGFAFADAQPASKQLARDGVRRPTRGRFAIGRPDGGAFASRRRQRFMQKARLARAGRPAQAHDAAVRSLGRVDRAADLRQQALAPDERREPERRAGSPPRMRARIAQLPDLARRFKSLEAHSSARQPADPRTRGTVRVVRNEDRVRLGRLLEPRREIDVRTRKLKSAALVRYDDVARVDADANRRRAGDAFEAPLDVQCGAGAGESMLAFGFVVGEDGENAVASCLDKRAAARANGLRHLMNERFDAKRRIFRIERGDDLGRALQVGEQDCRRSQLGRHVGGRRRRRSALGAIVGRLADRRSAAFAS
ncbi:MAG: hypothetical protein V9G24_03285 [Rhodoblastus sp.]